MNWYVIQTKPRKEKEAASYLWTRGLEVFNPLTEVLSPRNGKMEKIQKSLFPNYVFVKFDLDQSYNLVRWARGVKKVLGFGGSHIPLSDEVIELIKRRTDTNGIVRKTCHFEANEVIRIKSGPLRDLSGIFDRWVSDSERVRILLNFIGYQPTIEIHYSLLEKVA